MTMKKINPFKNSVIWKGYLKYNFPNSHRQGQTGLFHCNMESRSCFSSSQKINWLFIE